MNTIDDSMGDPDPRTGFPTPPRESRESHHILATLARDTNARDDHAWVPAH